MIPLAAAPPILRLDDLAHRAFLGQRELMRVTTALDEAGLIDGQWFTDESRQRGQYLHEAIALHHAHDLADESIDPRLQPYWDGYLAFLAESRFEPLHVEQAIYDETAGYAGRYDLVGQFPDLPPTACDLIEVKTGKAARWVTLQTMAYRRCLADVTRCRRWALELSGDGRYRLVALNLLTPITTHQIDRQADQRHEAVFLAAVTVANWKRGLMR